MKKFAFLAGKILCVLQLLIGVAFLIDVHLLNLLPLEYFAISCVVIILLFAISLVLTWLGEGRLRMTLGISFSCVVILICSIGVFSLEKTKSTYDSISGNTEIVHMGIYVQNNNAADYAAEGQNYRYGYIQDLDQESTEKVVQQMTDHFGISPTLQAYQKLPDLIDALLNGEVDAIILNQAYLVVLQEMDGYENITDQLLEVDLKQVEIAIPESTTPVKEDITNGNAEPFGVYISGIDTRGSVSVRSRSDVNILAVVNPNTRQILLISTPRDYYVPLSISDGAPDKLTHAGIYGIQVSKDTLAMLYGVEMDYYFRINFSGFESLIDALGGITVHSDYTFKADKGRYQIVQGENNLNGKAALAFCRERYALSGGDRTRGKHQMAVIQGVIKKALSPALLQNFNSVLRTIEGCFETSIPLDLIGSLVARQLKDGGSWNVVSYSVDGTGDYQVPYSMSVKAYVMQPDYATVDRAKELIQKVYNGEIIAKE